MTHNPSVTGTSPAYGLYRPNEEDPLGSRRSLVRVGSADEQTKVVEAAATKLDT